MARPTPKAWSLSLTFQGSWKTVILLRGAGSLSERHVQWWEGLSKSCPNHDTRVGRDEGHVLDDQVHRHLEAPFSLLGTVRTQNSRRAATAHFHRFRATCWAKSQSCPRLPVDVHGEKGSRWCGSKLSGAQQKQKGETSIFFHPLV